MLLEGLKRLEMVMVEGVKEGRSMIYQSDA